MMAMIILLRLIRKVAILGDMMDLGTKTIKYHIDILHYLDNCSFNKIFLYGKYYRKAFKRCIINKQKFEFFKDYQTISKELKKWITKSEETIAFIKGSRKMEMEKLLELLK